MRSTQRQIVLPALLLASSSVLLLSGCSSAFKLGQASDIAGPSDEINLKGSVHGGQAPIVGSAVSVYEIGATATTAAGYAAPLPAALATGTTDANGNWSLSAFTCANSNDELYLTAVGGEQVGNGGTSNTALAMTSVAGPCGAPFVSHGINIDEVATVATEYSLAGFSSDYQHVGTSATNHVGLTNAFATVTNLVNLNSGLALTNTPAYPAPGSSPTNQGPDVFSSIVPYDTINSIANVLAACVNTVNASDSGCTGLFSYTGGANSDPVGQNGVQGPVATNTADAALYVAHNPGLPKDSSLASNVSAFLQLPTPQAPFGPVINTSTVPNDLSLTLNFVGGGLGGASLAGASGANQITIDVNGNVWIPNIRAKTLTELSNLGAPLSPNTQSNGGTLVSHGGYAMPGATALGRLDSDSSGNVWVAETNDCVFGVAQGGSQLSGSPFISDCPSTGAKTVAVGRNGNVNIASATYVTAITSPGASVVSGFPITSGLAGVSNFIGPDYVGNTWFTDSSGDLGNYPSTGGSANTVISGVFSSANNYAAFDTLPTSLGGNGGLGLFVPEQLTPNAIQPVDVTSPFSPATSFQLPTVSAAQEIQTDGNGRLVVVSQAGSGIPANITVYTGSAQQVSSETTGFAGGSQLTDLSSPVGMAIDQSGNVWVVSSNNFAAANRIGPYGALYVYHATQNATVTEYVGLAAPTQPLNQLNAANSTWGVKP